MAIETARQKRMQTTSDGMPEGKVEGTDVVAESAEDGAIDGVVEGTGSATFRWR